MIKKKKISVEFKITESVIQRFFNKIVENKETKCWEWQGHRNKKGYGQLWVECAARLAHRVAYLIAHGSIPFGYQIDHLCRNTSCCNPEHLEAVLPLVNFYRSRYYYLMKMNDKDEDHPSYEQWLEWQKEENETNIDV